MDFQKQLEKQVSGILDNLQGKNFASVADYLQKSYTNGFVGNMYDMQGQGVPLVLPIDQNQVLKAVQKTGDDFKLANKRGISTNELKKQVQAELSRGLATDLTYAQIARNISDYGQADMHRAMNIARTEGHRVQNEARFDSMKAAKDKGADIVKQWDCTLDGNTRTEHAELDGQVCELDEDFRVGSYSAPYPGAFGDPYMDCNCRCCMLQRARWAVEDESTYTKWNNRDGGFIECSGYDDFKEKYLNAAESLTRADDSGIINVGSDNVTLENQRYGRNKTTLVNKTYIESGEYKRKYDKATDNEDVNKTLYDCAKTALKHRSGTVFEDMYWIDSETGKIVLSVTDSTDERAIVYTDKIKNIIKNNKNIVTLHTHPSSMPPSISDLNSCCKNKYKTGFVACHDGRVFAYSSNAVVNDQIYNMYIQRYMKDGYDEFNAQLKALERLSESYDIKVWEVNYNG